MKPVVTMVLLASERKARLLRNEGVGAGLVQVDHLEVEALADAVPDFSDTDGRSRAAPGMGRHGLTEADAEDRRTRAAIAARLADWLEREYAQADADRLVISAPPKLLGALRDALAPHLKAVLYADLDKDLTAHRLDDLPKHFAKVAAF